MSDSPQRTFGSSLRSALRPGARWYRERFRPGLDVFVLQRVFPHVLPTRIPDGESRPVTVSMTSTRARWHAAHWALESIFRQREKPIRVVLWMDESLRAETLPTGLRRLQERGLQIAFRPDVGPYTKLVYALEEFRGQPVITVDDDHLYYPGLVGDLFRAWTEYPGSIHANRVRLMPFTAEGQLLPFAEWPIQKAESITGMPYLPEGVGGVLYPPGLLDPIATNTALFRELCPHNDDLWFRAASLLSGLPVRQLPGRSPDRWCRMLWDLQKSALWNENQHGRTEQELRALESYLRERGTSFSALTGGTGAKRVAESIPAAIPTA